MEILGHSQLAMTTDLYSHVMPTALREAADAMDHVFVRRTEPRCCQLAFCEDATPSLVEEMSLD
jgi:hypothetical protein